MTPSRSPAVVSLHATKALSCGEGGFIVSTDVDLIAELRSLANFGFAGRRRLGVPGMNAKLSEYAAAIGLASLNGWIERRAAIVERLDWYLSAFAKSTSIRIAPGLEKRPALPTFNVEVRNSAASYCSQGLGKLGIETRQWWGAGCHRQPAFQECRKKPLPVTERLANSVIGLPFYSDMSKNDVDIVVASVLELNDVNGRA